MSSKKKVVKMTKTQLLDAVLCNEISNHRLIKVHWPKDRKKITLIEFVKKAREVRVSYHDIQFILWKLDRDGWDEAKGGEVEGTKETDRRIVNGYLELFGDAKGGKDG